VSDDDPSAMPPPTGTPVPAPAPVVWWRRRFAILPAWAWLVVLLIGIGGSLASLRSGGDDAAPATTTIAFRVDISNGRPEAVGDAPAPTSPATPTTMDISGRVTGTTSTIATHPIATTTAVTSTTAVATTMTIPSTSTTVTSSTTVAVTSTTSTTVAAPTTTEPTGPVQAIDLPAPVTVTGPNGESLTIVPRRGPCRYADLCLVVGFEVTGLPRWPAIKPFVCEFTSGARYYFRFSGTSVETACSSADIPERITVTVAGIESEMVFIER
jgi:hypothetical protein